MFLPSIWLRQSLVLHCASLLRTIFSSLVCAHEREHLQNLRHFPQTKLDNGITFPFLLNEHGDPQFFSHEFAKNSLIKKEHIVKGKKCLIVEHVLWPRRGLQVNHGNVKKCNIPATRQSKTA